MSDLLDDPAIHRQLVEAVRTRCSQDWQASRRHRLARLRTHGGWATRPLMLVWALVWGVVLAAPFFWIGEDSLQSHEAAGLTALHLLCVSLFMGRAILDDPAPGLSPLLNMPVQLAQIHRHLLWHHRRQAAKFIGIGLLTFTAAFFTTIVRMLQDVDLATTLWRVPVAALLAFGPSVALDRLFDLLLRLAVYLPKLILRCLALIPLALLGVLIWEFIFALEGRPSPGIIGDLFSGLPQARLCEWVRGADCPWQAVLLCLGFTVISGWRIHLALRDDQPELNEDLLHETPECTAEALLAHVLKERRMKEGWSHLSAPQDQGDDEGESELAGENQPATEDLNQDEDQEGLLCHESAPREHNTPVTPEFRAAMIANMQRLLNAPPQDCLLQKFMRIRGSEPPDWAKIRNKAVLLGAVPLILSELHQQMPETWNFWLRFATAMAAFLIGGKYLLWFTFGNQLGMGSWGYYVWPRVPLDGSIWLTQFAILERQWLRWRSQFAFIALAAFALTCALISLLKMAFGWQTGLVQIHMLYRGALSLPALALLLLALAWAVRIFEQRGQVSTVASAIKWHGIWRLWLSLHMILQLLSFAALFLAMIYGISMRAVDWDPKVGVPVEALTLALVVPMLLATALLQWVGRWLAVKSLRSGDGSVR
jgi:hypothetical protein